MNRNYTTSGSFQPLTQRVQIGARSVTFLAGPESGIQAIWDPDPPSSWEPAQLFEYLRAREAFVARMDQELGSRMEALVQAGEACLSARAAGVTVVLDDGEICFQGDPLLVDAWSPVLHPHREALAVLAAARRRS